MTDTELNQYKAIRLEIADLNRRIADTKAAEVIQFGTVKGSSKNYPFVAKNFSVSGIDPADTKRREKQITELLRKREVQRNELIKKLIEIENFIENIDDSVARTIFRMCYIDGLTQIQIAEKNNYSQGRVSQIIKEYLKSNKINKIMC